jgi:hypothetical protein
MRYRRSVYRVLVGRAGGKRPLGRPKLRREDNIKMDLQKVGSGVMNWMELTRDRNRLRVFVNSVTNLRNP